jgi:hypothetical protein
MQFTFGKNIAAQRIEILLNDNLQARRKITRLLSKYTQQLLSAVDIKDHSTVKLFMELIREHTLKRLDSIKNLSPEIHSYAKNVVIGRYRVFRHQFEIIEKTLKSKK